MSRDEQNILVVSYGEIKQFLEQSWAEVEAASANVSDAAGALPRGGPTRTDLAHSHSAAASIALPGAAMMASDESMVGDHGVLRTMSLHGVHGD
jgi:hypothetical protein